MNKKNIIVIAIVAILAISLLAVGAFLFEKKKATSVTVEPKKEFAAVEGEEGMVWFPVPELGIEIKVNKDIAPELVYQVKKSQTGKDIASVGFTTERMQKIAEKRGLTNENGAYACPIGGFTRYNVAQEELEKENAYEYLVAHGTYIDGTFVVYGSPQAACSYGPDDKGYNASDREYEQYIVSNWLKMNYEDLKGSLQQSVRRLQ